MTKEQVIEKLGKEPDNLIGGKKYVDGIVEVLQYTDYLSIAGGFLEDKYWLYF